MSAPGRGASRARGRKTDVDRASRDATLAGGGTHVIRREGVGGIAQEHGRLAHRAVADHHHLHGDVHLLALHLCVSGTDARACQRRGVAGSRARGGIRARARGRLGGFARGARDGSGETCRRKGSRTHGGRRSCAPTRRRRALLCRGRDLAIRATPLGGRGPRADQQAYEQIQKYFAGGAASELGILRRARRTLAMSRRRKHVRELVDEPCPELGAGDAVCRVVELRGGNHIEARPVHATPPSTAAAALPPRHPQPRARVPAPPTA